MPRGLHARLCHAFLVYNYSTRTAAFIYADKQLCDNDKSNSLVKSLSVYKY